MTLVDPTGGVGYAFGAKWPSADASTIATQQPNALDSVNGGTYSLGANLTINASPNVVAIDNLAATLTAPPTVTAYTRTRWQPQGGAEPITNWGRNNFLGATEGYWTNTVGPGDFAWELSDLVDGATLTNIAVAYRGATGHAGDPVTPGIAMPQWVLRRYDLSTGNAFVPLLTVIDPFIARASYEAYHLISNALGAIPAPDKVVDLSQYRYELVITSESGADYQAEAVVHGVEVQQSVSVLNV